MTFSEYVPKDKFDFKAVDHAKCIGFPTLNPILPKLLMWLQDLNWPVAGSVASLLADADEEILPHIRKVLSSNDSIWKYSVLTVLVPNLDPQFAKELTADLIMLADHPSDEDRRENVDRAAKELLGSQ